MAITEFPHACIFNGAVDEKGPGVCEYFEGPRMADALQNIGVSGIMVTEYFKSLSQASRFEFLCDDDLVETARAIIHKLGTSGGLPDHAIIVEDFEVVSRDNIPLGQRMSVLQKGLAP